MSPRCASSAAVALNWSEKLRLFVISISIHSGWIHLGTLSKFARPLHCAGERLSQPTHDECSAVRTYAKKPLLALIDDTTFGLAPQSESGLPLGEMIALEVAFFQANTAMAASIMTVAVW